MNMLSWRVPAQSFVMVVVLLLLLLKLLGLFNLFMGISMYVCKPTDDRQIKYRI